VETNLVRKDGEVRRVAITCSSTQPGEETLCTFRELAPEVERQEALVQAERMSAIAQLVSGVAHEINNPLASISAFAQILLGQRELSPDDRHAAEIIYSEARRAARIVNNLLTFVRQHKATTAPAQINSVLQDTLELRTHDLRARGIDVVVDLDPQIRETMVDTYQLQQVFLNLLNNAEHAMALVERARHTLTARTRSLPSAIRIEIEDTGPGVPPDSLEKIFAPFYTTKPQGSATGLGLPISRGIVQEHGGSIRAENVAGGGARFVIEIPYVEPVAEAPETRAPAPPVRAAGLRILIADDEDAIRLALGRYLKAFGHEPVATGRGTDALARARTEPFDAIILDVRMPDMSGLQVFEQLSADRPEVAKRVVFITGDISEDLNRFLTSSGCPFLIKPFELSELLPLLPKT
jgi:two-component system NtrC family sensor kinase